MPREYDWPRLLARRQAGVSWNQIAADEGVPKGTFYDDLAAARDAGEVPPEDALPRSPRARKPAEAMPTGPPPPLAVQTGTAPLDFHPLAALFPLIEGQDFEALVADIAAHGLLEPIVLYEGQILDGRNRYRACQRLHLPYAYVEYQGQAPLDHVISLNVRRRHLTTGQKALLAAALANMTVGGDRRSDHSAILQNDQVSQAEAAARFDVSVRTVADAQKLRSRQAWVLIEAVEEGWLKVSGAVRLLDEPPEIQQRVIAQARAYQEFGETPPGPGEGQRPPGEGGQRARQKAPRRQGRRITYTDVMRAVAEDSDDWTAAQWADLSQLVDERAGEGADRAAPLDG
jgi:hypothetical protein